MAPDNILRENIYRCFRKGLSADEQQWYQKLQDKLIDLIKTKGALNNVKRDFLKLDIIEDCKR
jgi:hypothetical protein